LVVVLYVPPTHEGAAAQVFKVASQPYPVGHVVPVIVSEHTLLTVSYVPLCVQAGACWHTLLVASKANPVGHETPAAYSHLSVAALRTAGAVQPADETHEFNAVSHV